MKKFRITLPLVALVLAVAASAFTAPSSSNARTNDDLYWYFFDHENNALNGQIGSGTVSQQDALDATDCPNDGMIDCARGYLTPQSPTQANPGLGVDQIKRVQ